MIEKMKLAYAVTTAAHKEELLSAVRDLGVLHLSVKKNASSASLEKLRVLTATDMLLGDYAVETKKPEPLMSEEAFLAMHEKVLEAAENKKRLEAEKNDALLNADKIRAWGDFDPEQVKALANEGISLHFYRMGKKELEDLNAEENIRYIRLASVEKMETVAVLGTLPQNFPANEFELPEESVSALEAKASACEKQIAACTEILKEAAKHRSSYAAQILKAQNEAEYSAAGNSAEGEEELVWLTGYLPEADVPAFKEAAQKNGWAIGLCDPEADDENVPTKVKYNKVTKLMRPVFDILGTVPGYREYDISFWFLCFFALFTAMIIGDAGYGVLFLALGVALHVKQKKASDVVLLLYVLSIATIAWGAVTGTWFGLESAMNIPFLKALVIPGIANYPEAFGVSTTAQQNNVMKFCFVIGTVQLSLACIMNVKAKLPKKDLSLIADIGWLIAIDALYVLVLYLVIGENVSLTVPAICVGLGFVLVVMFGGMAPDKSFSEGLKEGLGGAFTTFLNTISAFGNVMSYIRLFAVGMASLAIAQSFNDMASGFSGGLVVIGAIIMIIGHALNIVMGLLSVVVHGVRLNLLEFSGQLGMEWSGKAYDPFRKLDKISK